MPKLKTGTLLPSAAEDAAITAAALSDPDAVPLTEAEWAEVQPRLKRGRPRSTRPVKVSTTLRMDADVLEALRATGRGWQTRLNEVMREWVKKHPAG